MISIGHLRSRLWSLLRKASVQGTRRGLLTVSYVEGPLEPPLTPKTLPEYWRSEILAKYSGRPALIALGEKPSAHGGPVTSNMGVSSHLAWDFEEFGRHADALARGLIGMGVHKGDRVGVIMGNTSAYAMLQLACASIGAILVTINPAYRPHELVNALQLVGVQHLFVVPHIQSSHYLRILAEEFPEMRSMRPGEIKLEGLPNLRNIVVIDNEEMARAEVEGLGMRSAIDWRQLPIWTEGSREGREQQDLEKELKCDDIINLQYTSGTTGLPKAVSLTHKNLLNNGIQIGRRMQLTHQDLLCRYFLGLWKRSKLTHLQVTSLLCSTASV